MKKNPLNKFFRNAFKALLQLFSQTNLQISGPFAGFCILLFFSHSLNSVLRPYYNPTSRSFNAFLLPFLFSDISNYSIFLSSTSFSLFLFIAVSIAIYLPLITLILLLLQPKKSTKNPLAKPLVYYLSLYNWLFLIPYINVLLSGYKQESNASILNQGLGPTFAIIGFICNLFLGFLSLLANASREFLDIYALRLNISPWLRIGVFLLRVLLAVLGLVLTTSPILFYLLLQTMFLFLGLASFGRFTLRNGGHFKFFLATLGLAETILISMFLMEFTNNLYDDGSVFFVAVPLGVLAVKIGEKAYVNKYRNCVYLNQENSLFFLEELFDLTNQNLNINEKILMLSGTAFQKLKLGIKTPQITLVTQTNFLILGRFKQLLHACLKHPSSRESLLLKFFSFLLKSNLNPPTAYLELLRVGFGCDTFVGQVYRELMRRQLEDRIKKMHSQLREELSTEKFVKTVKRQRGLDAKLKELLREKRAFWELYQLGIIANDSLLEAGGRFFNQVEAFNQGIQKPLNFNNEALYLIELKFRAIIHSTLLNSLNMAVRLEEEFENLVKRHLDIETTQLHPLSFLDRNVAITSTSALSLDGRLKDKPERLGRMFGYTASEFQGISNLAMLMPEQIAKRHNMFIKSMLKRPKSKAEKTERVIESYGLHKQGFTFPIRIFHGFGFDFKNDLMLLGAVLKKESQEAEILLDGSGKILGISNPAFVLLREAVPGLVIKDMEEINFGWLLGGFEGFLGTEMDGVGEMSGDLRIPGNLKAVAEELKVIGVGREKEKEEVFRASSRDYRRFGVSFKAKRKNYEVEETEGKNVSWCTINFTIKRIKRDRGLLTMRTDDEEERQKVGLVEEISSWVSSADIQNPENLLKPQMSHKASSLGENKTESLIFGNIKEIQSTHPSQIRWMCFFMFIEVLMVVSYFAVLLQFYRGYVASYYDPTQHSLINYCSLATSLSYATAMFTELEYSNYNLTTRVLSPMKKTLWSRIMSDNYELMKSINYQERNNDGGLPYQEVFKQVKQKYIDSETMKISTISYADNLELWSMMIYTTIHGFNNSLTAHEQITLQRNYPYMLPATSVIYLAVKSDFTSSNVGTTSNILNLLIAFLAANGVLKAIELVMLLRVHSTVSKIVLIFRRVGQQDAQREAAFAQQMLDLMAEPYLKSRFSEKLLGRRGEAEETGRGESFNGNRSQELKGRNVDKQKKKGGFYNVRPLSRTKFVIFVLIILSLSFLYYFFNYYFWISNNVAINNLISINSFFIDVYIYSTSIIGFNTMALRERVARNPDYEKINETYQNHQTRLTYFFGGLTKRVDIIGNTTAFYLPRYTLEAQKNMMDPIFDIMVYSDTCSLLLGTKIKTPEELEFCHGAFQGGFNKGILSLVDQYIQIIKDFEILTKVLPVNDTAANTKQTEAVKQKINSQQYEDFMFSYYFYHNILLFYYNTINNYYKGVMDQQMGKLYLFLGFSAAICGTIFVLLSIFIRMKLKSYYKQASMFLSIIPYERLINDEQMRFLISSFLKKL